MNAIEALESPSLSFTPVAQARALRAADPVLYVKTASAIMKTACELNGQTGSMLHMLYTKLAAEEKPSSGAVQLASVVYTALGKAYKQAAALEKVAFGGIPRAWGVLTGGAALSKQLTPKMLMLIGSLGVASGAAGGGAVWGANRLLTKDDQKNRELEIQRDTYSRLTAEVENELKRRNLTATPENTAAVVDYLT